jgi:hypothetical protein
LLPNHAVGIGSGARLELLDDHDERRSCPGHRSCA